MCVLNIQIMNLAIDIGNSSIKIGVFDNHQLQEVVADVAYDRIPALVEGYKPDRVVISSVNQNANQLVDTLESDVLVLEPETPLPISISYKTPETLGKDRIAAAVGAHELFPSSDCLVIDIGTCITYEIVDAIGTYHGGGISPGVDMKFKALHTFTANLPLVQKSNNVMLIGDTTESAIQSGVILGTVAEIEEIIRMYKDKFSPLRIIMCGGGARYFESRIKTTIDVHPELVLIGLNGILKHNA